jgi:hypothetical protein
VLGVTARRVLIDATPVALAIVAVDRGGRRQASSPGVSGSTGSWPSRRALTLVGWSCWAVAGGVMRRRGKPGSGRLLTPVLRPLAPSPAARDISGSVRSVTCTSRLGGVRRRWSTSIAASAGGIPGGRPVLGAPCQGSGCSCSDMFGFRRGPIRSSRCGGWSPSSGRGRATWLHGQRGTPNGWLPGGIGKARPERIPSLEQGAGGILGLLFGSLVPAQDNLVGTLAIVAFPRAALSGDGNRRTQRVTVVTLDDDFAPISNAVTRWRHSGCSSSPSGTYLISSGGIAPNS